MWGEIGRLGKEKTRNNRRSVLKQNTPMPARQKLVTEDEPSDTHA